MDLSHCTERSVALHRTWHHLTLTKSLGLAADEPTILKSFVGIFPLSHRQKHDFLQNHLMLIVKRFQTTFTYFVRYPARVEIFLFVVFRPALRLNRLLSSGWPSLLSRDVQRTGCKAHLPLPSSVRG